MVKTATAFPFVARHGNCTAGSARVINIDNLISHL